jgi:hypothetical protein
MAGRRADRPRTAITRAKAQFWDGRHCGRWAEQKAPMGGMMMQDDAMKAQMSRMMENCNKMKPHETEPARRLKIIISRHIRGRLSWRPRFQSSFKISSYLCKTSFRRAIPSASTVALILSLPP